MCESSRSWLIITFLILVLHVNDVTSSVGWCLDNVNHNCLGPTSKNLKNVELRNRKLLVIQAFTSCRQASILGSCTISSGFMNR